jgi:hypothetical protein
MEEGAVAAPERFRLLRLEGSLYVDPTLWVLNREVGISADWRRLDRGTRMSGESARTGTPVLGHTSPVVAAFT